MPRKILNETRLREIFKDKQISGDAIDWLDEQICQLLTRGYDSVKDNPKVKRITKGIAKFIVDPTNIGTGMDEKEVENED